MVIEGLDGLLAVDVEGHLVGERDDGQRAGPGIELLVVAHARAQLVMRHDDSAFFRDIDVAADMIELDDGFVRGRSLFGG